MPRLEKAIIQNWRNITLQELDFCPDMNCICGNNGEGKTNLLDAVYYLSMTKSAFSSSDRYNFRKGEKSFSLCGTYELEEGVHTRISVSASEATGEKKVFRDGKQYSKISDHIGLVPIVMVSPGDSSLVSEGGEERRRFFSAVLSQTDRQHLSDLQNYNKLLAQRNALLKRQDCSSDMLDSLDYTMDRYAARIHSSRAGFTDRLKPLVQAFYDSLSSSRETVDIIYRSDLEKGSLQEILAGAREKDRLLQYTSAGVHRDEFLFLMNGDPIKKTGSQGQQKCFLVALKFAQYSLMKSIYTFPPILVLDDLFDKLDMQRTEQLLQTVSGSDFGQIFLSDTHKDRLRSIIDKFPTESRYYEVEKGEFKR